MNIEKIGKYISDCRKAMGLSQQQLAEQLNISNKTISKWETGKGLPDISMLPILAERLNTSVDSILNGCDSTKKNNSEAMQKYEVTETQIVKHTRRFSIMSKAALSCGIIGFLIILLMIYNGSGFNALMVGSFIDIVCVMVWLTFYHITKSEYISYNCCNCQQKAFTPIWVSHAIIGTWIWCLMPIWTIVSIVILLLPIPVIFEYSVLVIRLVAGIVYIIISVSVTSWLKKHANKCRP